MKSSLKIGVRRQASGVSYYRVSCRLSPVACRLVFLFSIFFSYAANSQILRHTTFDDRPLCEKDRGVWRQFGNGCYDECESKFDPFLVCTDSANFGCDCGRGRCWNGDGCTTLREYKKIFDVEKAEEEKILSEARIKRQKAAKENQQQILATLITDATSRTTINAAGEPVASNNLSAVLEEKNIDVNAILNQYSDNPVLPAGQNMSGAPMGRVVPPPAVVAQPQEKIEELPPIIMPITAEGQPVGDTAPLVPPFFLQQEEKARQEAAAKAAAAQNSAPPGLPEVPLPN